MIIRLCHCLFDQKENIIRRKTLMPLYTHGKRIITKKKISLGYIARAYCLFFHFHTPTPLVGFSIFCNTFYIFRYYMCVYIKTYESSRNQPKDFTILKLQLDLPQSYGTQFQKIMDLNSSTSPIGLSRINGSIFNLPYI